MLWKRGEKHSKICKKERIGLTIKFVEIAQCRRKGNALGVELVIERVKATFGGVYTGVDNPCHSVEVAIARLLSAYTKSRA